MNSKQIRDMDKRMLHDFFSLGAWVHQYTSIALYRQAQQVLNDKDIDKMDLPRIQMTMRAQIAVQAFDSLRLFGRFCSSVLSRGKSGIAYSFLNDNHCINAFYRTQLQDNETIENTLRIPSREELEQTLGWKGVSEFLTSMQKITKQFAEVILNSDKEDHYLPIDKFVKSFQKGFIINNPIHLFPLELYPRQEEMGYVSIVDKWPLTNSKELSITRTEMSQDSVLRDLGICKDVSIILSNLCQLLIKMIERDILTYESVNEGTHSCDDEPKLS
ncbi:MAG: hypothetical protein ACYCYO_01625 [Bacilli bacterium]